ncbi:hypothetical protein JHQ74_10930, partial [Neisseria meningitidis]|uniref:hypothetical protein n=1 Tax=Neisseria meningitidis TaxID=487 RepID=UPI001EE014A1
PWGNLPPPDWPRVAGIDLGFENPFVCEWFAISPEEHWYRYRELYLSQVTIDEHAAHLKRIDEEELAALREASARMDSDSQKNYADHLQ